MNAPRRANPPSAPPIIAPSFFLDSELDAEGSEVLDVGMPVVVE